MTIKQIEYLQPLIFKNIKEKELFIEEIKKISTIGIITENNYIAVYEYREKLQKKLIRRFQNPARLIPSDRNSLEYKEWRKAVLERDNYTCVECHRVGGILHVHHIKCWADYPQLRYELDNGVTLCKECHELTDTYLWRYFRKNDCVSMENNN